MVAGLEDPTAGQILIGGQDISHKRPYQRPVNTVFQSYALFPHMTIFENVAFGLRRRKESDIDRRVNEMLELVEMQNLAKRRPTQLSGGQQQRIAVVRALVNKPKVLLLDEPLGALDLKLRRQMQLELKRIQTEVGITFIHVTHDQEEAMTMADTIAVLNKGKVEQMGAPIELYENPRTAFVAGFLGQTNLLSVNVLSRDDDVVKVDFHGITLLLPAKRMAATGTAVEAGVRPEKLQIADLGEAPDNMNSIDGTIIDTSFIGVSTQYLVRSLADAEEELTVFSQNSATELRRVGEQVSLYWHPEHTFGLHEGAWKEAEAAEVAS
jgi:spermidine/putrescine transport system ATP-binding protein